MTGHWIWLKEQIQVMAAEKEHEMFVHPSVEGDLRKEI